jgi:hypothetical protein
MLAPLWPILTTAEARPSFTNRFATLMLAPRRPRTSLACSSIPITSGASTISSGSADEPEYFPSSACSLT